MDVLFMLNKSVITRLLLQFYFMEEGIRYTLTLRPRCMFIWTRARVLMKDFILFNLIMGTRYYFKQHQERCLVWLWVIGNTGLRERCLWLIQKTDCAVLLIFRMRLVCFQVRSGSLLIRWMDRFIRWVKDMFVVSLVVSLGRIWKDRVRKRLSRLWGRLKGVGLRNWWLTERFITILSGCLMKWFTTSFPSILTRTIDKIWFIGNWTIWLGVNSRNSVWRCCRGTIENSGTNMVKQKATEMIN